MTHTVDTRYIFAEQRAKCNSSSHALYSMPNIILILKPKLSSLINQLGRKDPLKGNPICVLNVIIG